MKLNNCILRIFEVRAKPGKAGLLAQKLSDTSVSVVEGQPGNMGHFFGNNLSGDENDLVFISAWRDIDVVKTHFGDNWRVSYLPEGYDELIESCSVKHIEVSGDLTAEKSGFGLV